MPSNVKVDFVKKLTDDLKSSGHVVVTEYQGMTAEEFDALRAALSPLGAKFKVVKNRLAKIALKNTGDADLLNSLKGASALAYQGSDGLAVTKALFKFGEQHTNFKVKAGRVFGITADSKGLKTLSNLPSREVLMATLLSRLQSPLVSLVRTMNEPLRSLHAALGALAKKKEAVA